ncbi:MAG: hypothetical protein Q8S17_04005 [Humidesulfovibrio sp.]|nr:hypothetical protein [Humidesulfovibrio sp.]
MRNPHPASPAQSPENQARNAEASPLCQAPRHPVGLLYTMLRHGRGLSHEEAHRISFESIHGQPVQGPSGKAA